MKNLNSMKMAWELIEEYDGELGDPVLLVIGFETKRVVMGEFNMDSDGSKYWWVYESIGGFRAKETYGGLPTHFMRLPKPPKR